MTKALRKALHGLVCAALLLSGWASAATLVNFAWDSSESATGYYLYCGASSGSYGAPTDVGDVTQAALALTSGQTHYCAVKAYNDGGPSDDYSNEVVFHVKPEAPAVRFGRQ